VFIIDGSNLLWSVWGAGTGPENVSDVGLCRLVGAYLRRIGRTGELVFDGTGPRDKTGFDNIDGVEVVFAGVGTDADTVIEGKIKANTAPRRLTVVSSDNRLRRAARARRANAVKSEELWSDMQRELRRKKRGREPNGKLHGLSDGETEQWFDFFGMGP